MIKKIILIVCLLVTSGCSRQSIVKKQTQLIMGTIVEVTIADFDKNKIDSAFQSAFSAMKDVETLMSNFIETSEVNRINNLSAAQPQRVSYDTYYVLKKSKEFSFLSDGAFDITVWPLVELWGFGKTTTEKIPDEEKINRAKEFIGYENILLNDKTQTVSLKKEGVKIGLGAIAKGYAVDKAIGSLKAKGIKNAIVNAGGDIYCLGKKGSQSWKIGIQHPRIKNKILTTLALENKAVATSGDYEKYFVINDKRYSHIINPKTGYPVETSPTSVTVVADDCLTADGLATAVYVLGPQKGLDLVSKLKGIEAMIITQEDNKLKSYISNGLLGKVKIDKY